MDTIHSHLSDSLIARALTLSVEIKSGRRPGNEDTFLTSCCMWSLMTMFLTLSRSWTNEIRDVVAMETLSTILEINN